MLQLGRAEDAVRHGRRDEAAAGGGERRQKHDGRHKTITHFDTDFLFNRMAPHKRFIAWQECHKLVLAVYKATESFPKHDSMALPHNRGTQHSRAPQTSSRGRRGRDVTSFVISWIMR